MKKYGEQKEQLLMQIEGTADWRRTKAHEYPQSEEINLHAAGELDKLAAWVKKLPESHPVFKAYWNITGETEIEIFNNQVRSYGYQNQSETPEEFVNNLVQETDLNGSVSAKVEQKDKSPKKVFILGSQAESVYAHLLDDKGKVKAMAVPVASEPFPFWNGEGASQIIQKTSISSEFEKLTPVNINYNGGFGKKIDKWFLKPLGYKREDAWFCYVQPFARIKPNGLEILKNDFHPLSHAAHFPESFDSSESPDESRVQEILSELEQSQAKTIILIGEMPVKHFISHFSKFKRLSDFGESLLDYGKYHNIKIAGKSYRVIALTYPGTDENFKTGEYIWRKNHKYWYAKNMMIESLKILDGEDPTFVDKEPKECPICLCRKIARFEIEGPTLSQEEESDIREGRLILKKEISEDDPIYICTECEFEFYDKKVERKFQLVQ